MRSKRLVAGGASAVALLVTLGYVIGWARAAGVPALSPVMTYSGTLTDSAGAPLTGTRNIQLQIWDAASGGAAPVCTTTSSPRTLVGGSFQIDLPMGCVTAVHAGAELWSEIMVDGASLGRTKIGAVPYALEAGIASGAAGTLATSIVPAGAVMAFDLDACPAGWSPFTSANGRTIVGTNATGGGGLSARTRGQTFGEEAHTLTTAEMPAHVHAGTTMRGNAMTYRVVYMGLGAETAPDHATGWMPGTAFADYTDNQYAMAAHTHNFTTANTGGGATHNVMQPSVVLLYCRKN